MPIVFMSARDQEFDRIIGLEKVVMNILQTIQYQRSDFKNT